MARVDLKCDCGHVFFVADAQMTPQKTATCPACDSVVKAPASAPAKAAPAPAADPFGPPPSSGSKKKLLLIVGGAAVAVVVLGIILAVAFSGPKVDYAQEAAKAVEARKKAFEEVSSKAPAAPTVAPKTPVVPETAKVVPKEPPKAPVPAPRPKETPVAGPATAVPAATAPAAKPADGGALPTETVVKLRTELLPLHPFYANLVLSPAEKARMDGLVAAGRGTSMDVDFLQTVLTGAKLKAVRDEIALIAQTTPTAERESQEGLPVDRVTLTDGRVMSCRILDEGVEIVKVSRNISGGVGGQLPLRRDNISKMEKGKGIGTEFATRWESARKGALPGLIELMGWCKENTLTGQARLVAYTIARLDPSNTQARSEVGLPADPVKHAEEAARGGILAYQGRNWPAKELQEKLLKDGYSIVNGQWFSRKDKLITVPGLFRYERQADKPVTFIGAGLLSHEHETTFKVIQDPASNSIVEQPETKLLRRFYSPMMTVVPTQKVPVGVSTPPNSYEMDYRLQIDEGVPAVGTLMKGELTITVPVGDPLLEATLTTTAEVKAGGAITIFHVTGTGETEKRTRLYACDAKETQAHVLPPALIRGLTDLTLIAVIEQTATYAAKIERRHVRDKPVMKGKQVIAPALDVVHYRQIPEYKAMLFPSQLHTIEVLRLKAVVAESAPQLDKLFAGNPELLK